MPAPKNINDLVTGVPLITTSPKIERQINAEQDGEDLIIKFKYSQYDAIYKLLHANRADFENVIKLLRDKLARLSHEGKGNIEAIKTADFYKKFLKVNNFN